MLCFILAAECQYLCIRFDDISFESTFFVIEFYIIEIDFFASIIRKIVCKFLFLSIVEFSVQIETSIPFSHIIHFEYINAKDF